MLSTQQLSSLYNQQLNGNYSQITQPYQQQYSPCSQITGNTPEAIDTRLVCQQAVNVHPNSAQACFNGNYTSVIGLFNCLNGVVTQGMTQQNLWTGGQNGWGGNNYF